MTNCPSCGSKNVEKTNKGNAQECSCNECLATFNPNLNEQYNEFSYDHFLDSVANKIQEGMIDAHLGSAVREIMERHINNGPQDVGMIIDRLVPLAEDLYNDYKMNRREKYDFGALMEGINRLNEFALLQNPMDGTVNDDTTPNEVPDVQSGDVNELPDPMNMVNPETDPAAEVGEHSSLEKLKNAISSVQTAIQGLEDSEKKEREAAGVEAEPVMPAYDPQQNPDLVHEGMQDAAINMPPLPGVDDETPEANPMNANLANSNSETKVGEGPEHEAEEDVAITDLKKSLAELQAAYAEYIGSEVKVHGDGEEGSVIGTTPETGIGGPLKSDLGDRVNALSKVNGVENGIYLEKAKELMEGFTQVLKEDAELTSDDNMIKSYDNSITISHAEIAKDPLIGNSNAPVNEEGEMSIKDLPEAQHNLPSEELTCHYCVEIQENVMADLGLIVSCEYETEAPERMTHDHPGSPGGIEIYSAKIVRVEEISGVFKKDTGEVIPNFDDNSIDTALLNKDLFELANEGRVGTTDHGQGGVYIEPSHVNEKILARDLENKIGENAADSIDGEDDNNDPAYYKGKYIPRDIDENAGTEGGEIADQPGEIMNPVSPEDQAAGFDQIDNNQELIMITPDGTKHAAQKYNSDVIDAMKAIGCTFTPNAPVDESKYSKELGVPNANDDATFGINHTFNIDDNVLFEGHYRTITNVDGQYLTLVDSHNEYIEVLAEDCEYANTEERDILGERFEQGNISLLNEWEKIDAKMNKEENLMGIKRQYDLREKKNVKFLVEDFTGVASLPVMNSPGIDDEDVQEEGKANPGFMLSNPSSNTATLDDHTAPAPKQQAQSKIDSWDYKGKKVIRLVAPNGLKAEVIPTMSNQGPRFYYYLDNKKIKSPDGQENWDLDDISKKLSNLEAQGVSLYDIVKLTTKLEVLNHHMMSPQEESNVPYAGKFRNPELRQTNLDETGYQYFEDAQSLAYINEGVEVAVKEDIEEGAEETNSNIELPESKEA